VLLIGGGIWIWKSKIEISKDGKVLVTPPANVKVNTYSLGGQVVSINDVENRIVFNAYIFYKDKNEEGIKPEQELRSAIITEDTKFSKMTQNNKEGIKVVDANRGDLRVGMNIVVYSHKNPTTNYEVVASRVEISP